MKTCCWPGWSSHTGAAPAAVAPLGCAACGVHVLVPFAPSSAAPGPALGASSLRSADVHAVPSTVPPREELAKRPSTRGTPRSATGSFSVRSKPRGTPALNPFQTPGGAWSSGVSGSTQAVLILATSSALLPEPALLPVTYSTMMARSGLVGPSSSSAVGPAASTVVTRKGNFSLMVL
ncbi:hypothetical protein T492DRAFT_16353 [Pavlovales sp. CCMP2436]|nr:hypothetical protein T492DRAFT_16353 [Pavlovales sp. CCMP2436]